MVFRTIWNFEVRRIEEMMEKDMIFWFIHLVVFVGSIFGLHYYLAKRCFYQAASNIPGPRGFPLIGNAFLFIKDIKNIFENIWHISGVTGEVRKLWLGFRLFVCVSDPADIELVLGNSCNVDKPIESKIYEPWIGDGVGVVNGNKWKAHRKLTAPLFHQEILQTLVPTFAERSMLISDKLEGRLAQEVDCQQLTNEIISEVLLETVLGEDAVTSEGKAYMDAVMKMYGIIRRRQSNFFFLYDFIFYLTGSGKQQEQLLRVIHDFTKKVIKNRKEKCMNYCVESDVSEKGVRKLSLLDIMLDSPVVNENLSEIELQNHLDNMIMEGYDKTVSTVSFFLYVMSTRPDIQEKCWQDVKRVLGNCERVVGFEDVQKMDYVERCVMEVLRLSPPTRNIYRKVNQEIKLASTRLIIPADSTVVVDVHRLHTRGDIYKDPNVFDPDNFLLERMASRHYYSYIPYSAGPRSCIGRKYSMLNMKVLLATILTKYEILPGNDEEKKSLSGKSEKSTLRFILRNHK